MVLTAFVAGTGIALAASSPVEWAIHKYILHAPPKHRTTKFIRHAAIAHNDDHHGAFKSPQHYYRDVTNEHVTVHFGKKDVALIAAITGAAGVGMHAAYQTIAEGQVEANPSGLLFVGGMVAGAMLYYGAYEFTHHYMHVIGERRMTINKEFGNRLQDGNADGNLRFPKPVLDDFCNAVEDSLDKPQRHSPNQVIPVLEEYVDHNRQHLAREDIADVVTETADAVQKWEDRKSVV